MRSCDQDTANDLSEVRVAMPVKADGRKSITAVRQRVVWRHLPAVLATGLVLAGCDGPNEKAGKARDKATAAAEGTTYRGEGPAERIGEAQDRAVKAAADARAAEAGSLRKQAQVVKAEADVEADRLEQQAEAVRKQAEQRAAPLEAQARKVRGQQ